MQITMPAGNLPRQRTCSPACLLAIEDDCSCRCAGQFHGLLTEVIITLDVTPRPLTVPRHDGLAPRVRTLPRATRYASDDGLLDAARAVNEQVIAATGTAAGVHTLKRHLGIGQDRAQRLRDALAALSGGTGS
jgi:hypothetical protein